MSWGFPSPQYVVTLYTKQMLARLANKEQCDLRVYITTAANCLTRLDTCRRRHHAVHRGLTTGWTRM